MSRHGVKNADFAIIGAHTGFAENKRVEAGGLEHPSLALSRTRIPGGGGAKSDAQDAPQSPKDPDLAFILHHWPELSPEIRNAITHMVRASVQLHGSRLP